MTAESASHAPSIKFVETVAFYRRPTLLVLRNPAKFHVIPGALEDPVKAKTGQHLLRIETDKFARKLGQGNVAIDGASLNTYFMPVVSRPIHHADA
jgi:hypothetical protein